MREISRKRPAESEEPCSKNKYRRRNLSSQTWGNRNLSWRGNEEILNSMGASTEDTSQRRDEQPTGECTTRHNSRDGSLCNMSGSATARLAGDTAAPRGTSQYDLDVTAAYFAGNDPAALQGSSQYDLDVTAAYFSGNDPAALPGQSQYDLDVTAAYFSGNDPAALRGPSQYDLDVTAACFSANDPAALHSTSQYDLDLNASAYFLPQAEQPPQQYYLANS